MPISDWFFSVIKTPAGTREQFDPVASYQVQSAVKHRRNLYSVFSVQSLCAITLSTLLTDWSLNFRL